MTTEALSMNATAPLIDFTDAAALKVKELIDEEGDANLRLRIYIEGGGCSGLKYGFTLDEQKPNDEIIEKVIHSQQNSPTVGIVIDPFSAQYLTGAKVDYKEDLSGATFIINNPQASTQCGCGSSFSVNDDA